jgi:hypothetical protein
MLIRALRFAALLLLGFALVACGGDGEPDEDPGAFATTLVRQLDRGDIGAAWEELHPLHQARIPRGRYVSCEQRDPIEGDVTGIQITDVRDEAWTIPGQDGQADSKAVTMQLTLSLPEQQAERFDLTVHLFDVDDTWRWVIGDVDYDAYAAGSCPAGG